MSETEFTIAGLAANLNTIRELVNGALTCYATDLEEFARSLLETSIYILDRTRERMKTEEDK